jgi:hypothetical protein
LSEFNNPGRTVRLSESESPASRDGLDTSVTRFYMSTIDSLLDCITQGGLEKEIIKILFLVFFSLHLKKETLLVQRARHSPANPPSILQRAVSKFITRTCAASGGAGWEGVAIEEEAGRQPRRKHVMFTKQTPTPSSHSLVSRCSDTPPTLIGIYSGSNST